MTQSQELRPSLEVLCDVERKAYSLFVELQKLSNEAALLGFSRSQQTALSILATHCEFSVIGIRQIRYDLTPNPAFKDSVAELGWTYEGWTMENGHVAEREGVRRSAPTQPLLLAQLRELSLS